MIGYILLFFTGFLWSWGAEKSKSITEYKDYYSNAFSFWGQFHRFNCFAFKLTHKEGVLINKLVQGVLAAFFFLPIIAILQSWNHWLTLIAGGMSYMLINYGVSFVKRK